MRSVPKAVLSVLLLTGCLVGLSCDSTPALTDDDTVAARVLVVYTPDARAAAADIEQHIADAVEHTNAVYENSRIDFRLVLAHLQEVDYTMTERLQDLERLLRTDDGYLDEVHQLRDRHEADLVVLVPDKRDATINGAVMATAETAFVIVHQEHLGAPHYGLAHELGHLHGARHTPDSDPSQEPFPYGHGFRTEALKTIMANGPQPRVPYFSGPDQVYEGLVLGDSLQQNAARVLRETAIYISNFRGPQRPTDFVPPGTWPVVDVMD